MILALAIGVLLGAVNGITIVLSKVPDIVVTLATAFVFAGLTLLVRPAPGGAAADWLKGLVVGPLAVDFIPRPPSSSL